MTAKGAPFICISIAANILRCAAAPVGLATHKDERGQVAIRNVGVTVEMIFLLFMYTLVAIFAVYMTYAEQNCLKASNAQSIVIGYLACLVWPILVVVCTFNLWLQMAFSAPRKMNSRV